MCVAGDNCCVCVWTNAAEESDVVERRVRVDELKRKQLDDEHVVVLRLRSMILYTHAHTHIDTYIDTDRQQPAEAYNLRNFTTSFIIVVRTKV